LRVRTAATVVGTLSAVAAPATASANIPVGKPGHIEVGVATPDALTNANSSASASGGVSPLSSTYSLWSCNQPYVPVQAQPNGYVIGNCLSGGYLWATQ
jgi:hypothetical protein